MTISPREVNAIGVLCAGPDRAGRRPPGRHRATGVPPRQPGRAESNRGRPQVRAARSGRTDCRDKNRPGQPPGIQTVPVSSPAVRIARPAAATKPTGSAAATGRAQSATVTARVTARIAKAAAGSAAARLATNNRPCRLGQASRNHPIPRPVRHRAVASHSRS